MDGVSEEQQAGSSSFSEEHVNAENVDNKTGTSKRLSRLEEKSERANEKVDQAKEKLPTKKKIKKQRLFDEKSGKAKTKLYFEDEAVQPKTGKNTVAKAGTRAVDAAKLAVGAKVHGKVSEVEDDNLA